MFRSSWDVLIRSTTNFIVSLYTIFVNRLAISKETKNLSTKLSRLGSSTNVKVWKCTSCSIVEEGKVREDYKNI